MLGADVFRPHHIPPRINSVKARPMTKPSSPAFDPADVAESNATGYPEPYGAAAAKRFNRRLGQHAGLKNFGVNITRIAPGGQSSHRHAHSTQDEFVYVLAGEAVLETNGGVQTLGPGMCAGFPAGTGNAHRFLNRGNADVLLLVVGDKSAGDEVAYPDIDMRGRMGIDGKYAFTRKDGSSF
jgi:uncharacterized cupin superfamily protein